MYTNKKSTWAQKATPDELGQLWKVVGLEEASKHATSEACTNEYSCCIMR
jgi:hypothetical protein